MWVARIICSDADCAERRVEHADTLEALETLICDCGCTVQILGVPDWVGGEPVVLALRAPGQPAGGLPEAA